MKRWLLALACCLTLAFFVVPGRAATSDIELFVTDWCPYCRKASEFLKDKNKSFKEYNIERDENAARRFMKLNPRGSVPFAVICGKEILGYSPKAYEQLLSACPN